MSTTAVSASQIMDRVANLLNDPKKTDYTYAVMIPYVNMAIEELSEMMEESNSSPSNSTSAILTVPAGIDRITPAEDPTPGIPHYPEDLTEVQEVLERDNDSGGAFVPLTRREFITRSPATHALMAWYWEEQSIKFNPNGATSSRQIQLKYVCQGIPYIVNENSLITMINARAYLAYKTASLCALFIGENQNRAGVLEDYALKAVERTTNISSKGRQQITTRHRPFRAAWKARGGY